MREKLINLIVDAKRTDLETGSFTEYLADHLIANGVTVQLPVATAERMPGWKDGNKSEMVLAYRVARPGWEITHVSWIINHPEWFSHWMPLPQPPGKDVK